MAAAGTGELYSLSPAEHLAVVKATIEEVKGKVPVLAGTGFNPSIAAELAKQAAAAGTKIHADEDGLGTAIEGMGKYVTPAFNSAGHKVAACRKLGA